MENNGILLRLYNEFTDETLNINNFEDKVIMQKIVFLLGELGITIGNYRFSLDKYGPFSQSLHNDIALISENDTSYLETFSESVAKKVLFLKNIFKEGEQTKYSLREWIEAVASFLFLKKYMYPSSEWKQINSILMELKNYLSDEESNEKAIQCCGKILEF